MPLQVVPLSRLQQPVPVLLPVSSLSGQISPERGANHVLEKNPLPQIAERKNRHLETNQRQIEPFYPERNAAHSGVVIYFTNFSGSLDNLSVQIHGFPHSK